MKVLAHGESRILNHGVSDETFTMVVHANTAVIGTQTLAVTKRNSATMIFEWNTSGVARGKYTLGVYAEPVQGETDAGDNSFTCGWVIVSIIGDVTSQNGWPDGKVDMRDIGVVSRRFQTPPGGPLWDPNYDINGDGKIDMKDIGITSRHFGESAP